MNNISSSKHHREALSPLDWTISIQSNPIKYKGSNHSIESKRYKKILEEQRVTRLKIGIGGLEREAQEQHLSGIIIICFVACSRSHTKLVSRASMHSQSQSQSQSELNEALLEAAEHGSITEIQSLLDRHADIHALDNEDATPLHLASWEGHHRCKMKRC